MDNPQYLASTLVSASTSSKERNRCIRRLREPGNDDLACEVSVQTFMMLVGGEDREREDNDILTPNVLRLWFKYIAREEFLGSNAPRIVSLVFDHPTILAEEKRVPQLVLHILKRNPRLVLTRQDKWAKCVEEILIKAYNSRNEKTATKIVKYVLEIIINLAPKQPSGKKWDTLLAWARKAGVPRYGTMEGAMGAILGSSVDSDDGCSDGDVAGALSMAGATTWQTQSR